MTRERRIEIHPTADVHPSVILEGNVRIGAFTYVGPGTVIIGNVTIGHHTLIQCNVVIRGTNTIGNYVHIYDLVCIEGGRPGGHLGGVTSQEPDRSIIGDYVWINHGATMHGSQLAEGAVLDLNACLDYNCRLGRDVLVANGTALRANTVVPDCCLVQGVPGHVVKEGLTDEDRRQIMGLVPREWIAYAAAQQEKRIRAQKGL